MPRRSAVLASDSQDTLRFSLLTGAVYGRGVSTLESRGSIRANDEQQGAIPVVLMKIDALLARGGCLRVEIPRSNQHQFLWIDVFASSRKHLFRGEILDLFLHVHVVGHGPVSVA